MEATFKKNTLKEKIWENQILYLLVLDKLIDKAVLKINEAIKSSGMNSFSNIINRIVENIKKEPQQSDIFVCYLTLLN